MPGNRIQRTTLLACAVLAAAHANGATFSFAGNFAHDDTIQFFMLELAIPSPVTAATHSYAAGGFDPILTLYDAAGTLLGSNDDGGCGAVGSDGGACLDAYLALPPLPVGDYLLAVSQSPNAPNGDLAAGFAYEGQGDFTCAYYLGLPGPFCDSTLRQRGSDFALDVTVDGRAHPMDPVPEPASAVLTGLGLIAGGSALRLYRKQTNQEWRNER